MFYPKTNMIRTLLIWFVVCLLTSLPLTIPMDAEAQELNLKTNQLRGSYKVDYPGSLSMERQFGEKLRGAVEDAIANSDGVKIAIKQVHISNTKIWSEIARLTPTIYMSLDASRSHNKLSAIHSAENKTDLNVELNIPIYSGGRSLFSIRAARRNKLAAKNDIIAAKNDLTLEVLSAYLQFNQAEETVKLLRQNILNAETLLNAVINRERRGLASKTDIANVRVNLASLRQDHEATKGTKSQINAQIENLTGQKFKNIVDLISVSELISYEEEELVQSAIKSNPEINAAQHRAVAQRLASRAEFGRYLPQVNFYAEYDQEINASARSQQEKNWQVGLRLRMPLVDLNTVPTVTESRQLAQIASYRASDLKRDIILSVRSLYREHNAGLKQLDFAKARERYLKQVVSSEQALFEKGIGSIDQLLEQKRAVAQSQIETIKAKTDVYLAAFQLLAVANKLYPKKTISDLRKS